MPTGIAPTRTAKIHEATNATIVLRAKPTTKARTNMHTLPVTQLNPMHVPQLFRLGNLVATPTALTAIKESGQTPAHFVVRHARGDWGDLSETDKTENNLSIDRNLRIRSAYSTAKGNQIYLLTDGDRSATTILLAEEY